MSKVLYLMGAGASRGRRDSDNNIIEGLPIVSEIPCQLERVISRIDTIEYEAQEVAHFQGCIVDLKAEQKRLVDDLQWMADKGSQHATIDTFAKKLFLTNSHDDYKRLKWALSVFFMLEELENKIDSRYDTFYANVLEKNPQSILEINSNISIVTWNYDSYFEIAMSQYELNMDVPEDYGVSVFASGANLIKSKLRCNPSKRVFKINGSASFSLSYSLGKYCPSQNSTLTKDRLTGLLNLYSLDNGCLLNFAWDTYSQNRLDSNWSNLSQELSDTEALVIIGYTFPFFNREVDRFIFSKMSKLKTVYCQDPNADNLIENIKTVMTEEQKSLKIVPIKNVDQFYIPSEL